MSGNTFTTVDRRQKITIPYLQSGKNIDCAQLLLCNPSDGFINIIKMFNMNGIVSYEVYFLIIAYLYVPSKMQNIYVILVKAISST